jgi:hypothetical protein
VNTIWAGQEPTNQRAVEKCFPLTCRNPFTHSVCEMYLYAVTWKYNNYNGDCVCADGFPCLVAKILGVAIQRTSVTKGVWIFERVVIKNCCLNS